jgi:hypothetical protein
MYLREPLTLSGFARHDQEGPMPNAEEQFATQVLACVDDLNTILPQLAARYDDLVIIAAFAEHVGGALGVFIRARICTPAQARRVLRHIADTAGLDATDAEG